MANLLKESFAIENVADFQAGKWTTGTLSAVGTSYGRLGGYGAWLSAQTLRFNIPGTPGTLIIGAAINPIASSSATIINFYDSVGQVMAHLQYDPNTGLFSAISPNNVVLGTYSASPSAFNYVEIKIVAATGATGSFVVKLNGTNTIFNLSSIVTSLNGTAIYACSFGVGGAGTGLYLADVYVNDTTGSTNNDFMGDVKQLTGRPTGAGLHTQWAIGGTSPAATNWQSVDDLTPNYDVTYVDDLTAGDIDLYTMSVPSGLDTFESLTVYAMVRKDDAGTRQVAVCISDGSTVAVGPTYTIGTTYSYIQGTWDINPFTSVAWAVADASTLQIGVKVIL